MSPSLAWKLLADLTVGVHALWVLLVISGPLITWYYPRTRWFHAGMMALTMAVLWFGKVCPLTILENFFRSRHDPEATYAGGFIVTYLEKMVYVEIEPRLVFALLVLWALLWTAAYIVLWPRIRKGSGEGPDS